MATDQTSRKKRRIRSSSEASRKRTEKTDLRIEKQAAASKKVVTSNGALDVIKWVGRHTLPKFVRDAFEELKNVTWPSLKQARQLTTAVLLFATIFAILVSTIDYGLDKIFKKVFLHE